MAHRRPLRALLARLLLLAAGGTVALARLLLFPRRRPRTARRVLVHRVGRVGDGVCALPALATIRAAYPAARITLLTSTGEPPGPGLAELLEGGTLVDRVRSYRPSDVRSPRRALALARELAAEPPDVWISLPQHLTGPFTELRNVLFARLAGSRWAHGFGVSSARWAGRGLGRALGAAGGPDETSALLERLRRAGLPAGDARPPVVPPPAEVVAELLGDVDGPLLGLSPDANRPANRWPAARFEALAARWIAGGGSVVVLGGSRARGALAPGPRRVDLAGRTTLREAFGVLREVRVLLSADTGLAHLGAAAGAPVVAVTAARDVPGRWAPHGEGHLVFRRDLACSPCWRDACPVESRCLLEIEVEDVWRALAPFLAAAAGRHSGREGSPTGAAVPEPPPALPRAGRPGGAPASPQGSPRSGR